MKTEVIRVESKGFCASKFNNAQVIKDMAEKGYSYVGYIPARIQSYGRVSAIDLVFERGEEKWIK